MKKSLIICALVLCAVLICATAMASGHDFVFNLKAGGAFALVNKNWTCGHEKSDTKVECLKTPSLTEP